jgi:hypothetical protein
MNLPKPFQKKVPHSTFTKVMVSYLFLSVLPYLILVANGSAPEISHLPRELTVKLMVKV